MAEESPNEATDTNVADELRLHSALSRGVNRRDGGDFQGAERAFEEADELGSAIGAHQLGALLDRRGNLPDAERAYRRAEQRGSAEAARSLAELLVEADRPEEADAALARAKALDIASASPPEREPFSVGARAVSDLPTDQDLLGFTPLVEGLRALLNVKRTRLPLAIAITGPWGAGKSSVMLQLGELLRAPGDRQPQERAWWVVKFDAWKYEGSERLWAALAKAIYEQPQSDMDLAQRIRFRLRVEKERLGLPKFLLKGAWPPVVALAAVIGAVATDFVSDPTGSSAIAPAIISSLAAFSAGAARYWGLASKPFKRAIERYASTPDYEGQLGFTSEADSDIRSLTRVLAPDTDEDRRALAVFVDDLDRCSSAHVVQVVEAMNQIFNSDERHGCVFVLGIDREVVATSIEVAYEQTVSQLREAGRPVGRDFGMNFLAKLVQLSVAVPQPSANAIRQLLSSITGNQPSNGTEAADQEEVKRAEQEVRRQEPLTLEEVSEASSRVGVTRPKSRQEVERRIRAELIRDSPDVIAAEFQILRNLDPNPRQIKRFDNAFRLQLYVANEDPHNTLDFSLDQLVALGKWVALRLRWPALAEDLDDEPWLLGVLEAEATKAPPPISQEEANRLKERYSRWFADQAVSELLQASTDELPSRGLVALGPRSFLQVT